MTSTHATIPNNELEQVRRGFPGTICGPALPMTHADALDTIQRIATDTSDTFTPLPHPDIPTLYVIRISDEEGLIGYW